MKRPLTIEIPKVSANQWNTMHFGKKKKIINDIQRNSARVTKEQISDTVNLEFDFYFSGKPLDVSNCFPLVKALEDCIMYEDNPDYVKQITIRSHYNRGGQHQDYEHFVIITVEYL